MILSEALIWIRTRATGSGLRPQGGDVVAVKPVGWAWSAAERLPVDSGGDFGIVLIHDIPPEDLTPYLVPEYGPDINDDHTGQPIVGSGPLIRAAAYHIDKNRIPGAAWNTLKRTGTITATEAQVRNLLRKHSDDSQPLP